MADQVVVKEYKGREAFQSDARKMASQGYIVASQSERTRRSGCLRIIMLGGVGALIWKPKPSIAVTYQLAGPGR